MSKLGKGAFGAVFLVKRKVDDGVQLAMKCEVDTVKKRVNLLPLWP